MQLELGNIAFNTSNDNQEYECPKYIVVLLKDIRDRLDKLMWNLYQKEYLSPFDNTGAKFRIPGVMRIRAFSWNEDNEQQYNFKYHFFKISWYKYLGRDTTINGQYSYEDIINMYNDCINALNEFEKRKYKERGENDVWFL